MSSSLIYSIDIEIPDALTYEGFPQLENGVGLIASMQEEFDHGKTLIKQKSRNRNVTIATGELAYPFISELAKEIENRAEGVKITVYAIKNNFFGGEVNVAGLVCGCDIIEQLKDKNVSSELLIPYTMLRDDDDVFLDDTTVSQIEDVLNTKLTPVLNDGYDFIEKVLGEELEF